PRTPRLLESIIRTAYAYCIPHATVRRHGRFCFFSGTPPPDIYTLSLHDALPISSSKGPKPLQLKLLTTYIPKTSAFTLAFSTSQRLRTTRASARTFFTFRHYITPSARNF